MPDTATVKSLTTPLDQALRQVFNAQKSYFTDILSFISFLWRQLDKAVFFKP